MYYQNVRGLRTKSHQFYLSVQSEDYDVYALTETWLNESFNSNEFFDDRYRVYRCDNRRDLSNKSRGGGVLLAVSTNFQILLTPFLYNTRFTDAILLVTSYDGACIVLCCVYICNDSPLDEYSKFYDFCSSIFDTLKPNFKLIIVGDFNIPDYFNSANNIYNKNRRLDTLSNFLFTNDLFQRNNVLNFNKRILDLVLTNIQNVSATRCMCPVVFEDAHHPSIQIKCNLLSSLRRKTITCLEKENFAFRRADFQKLYICLSNSNFEELYEESDVNNCCEKLYNVVYKAMETSIPKRKVSYNPKFPSYYTKKIIKLIKEKQIIFKRLKKKKKGSIALSKKYKELRYEVKKEIKKAHICYINECERKIKKEPKEIWSYTSKKLDKKSAIPSSIKFNGVNYSDPLTIANEFSIQFQSAYSKNNDCFETIDELLKSAPNNFTEFITKDEVLKAIHHLKPNASSGPDNIPPYIVKGCSELLASPLCYLFNLCIQCCLYPKLWKVSRVCPIFKKGERSNGENYRAVSILNCFSKCFEIVVYNRLLYHVSSAITPKQHGFVKGRSTVTNLTVFTSYVCECMSKKAQVDTIFFDFSLAFDKVSHSILLLKLLENFDIPLYLIFLLRSYLSDRSQYVTYNGVCSESFSVLSGVPQGSNLGPLLFILFINDIPDFLKYSNSLLYADDLKIYRIIQNDDDLDLLQNDIDSVLEWTLLNGMKINENKCEVVSFSNGNPLRKSYLFNGCTLLESKVTKDLGVFIDSKLNFQYHIQETMRSSQRILSFLFRIFYYFKEEKTFILLFNALVRSKLEYASCVWNSCCVSHSDSLEKVQKRFLRYLYYRRNGVYPHFLNHPVSTNQLLSTFNIVSLKERRYVSDSMFVYKIFNNLINCSCLLEKINIRVNVKNTRKNTFLSIKGYHNSPLNRMLHNFEKASENVDPFGMSAATFKKNILKT